MLFEIFTNFSNSYILLYLPFPLSLRFSHIPLLIFYDSSCTICVFDFFPSFCFNISSIYFLQFSVPPNLLRILVSHESLPPRNVIDEDDNMWCDNAAPTFAQIYVEHAGSPRVAKHTGPSEKRKHRRAAEDNCRQPPPSPGTAEIIRSPRHLPPPRLFSTPEMLSFSPSSMLRGIRRISWQSRESLTRTSFLVCAIYVSLIGRNTSPIAQSSIVYF